MPQLSALLTAIGHPELVPHELQQRYPHIAERIAERWGSDALTGYLDELIIMEQPGRQGFPPEVGQELMRLSIAWAALSGATADECDPWAGEPDMHTIPSAPTRFSATDSAPASRHSGTVLHFGASRQASQERRDEQGWTALIRACHQGRTAEVARLLQQNASASACDSDGYQGLHWAALQGHVPVMALLLGHGINPNVRSDKGITPLMLAASRGEERACALLLREGAGVNAVSADGWSALHKAAANGHVGTVLRLLEFGASPLQANHAGKTALDLVPAEHARLAQLLDEASSACEREADWHGAVPFPKTATPHLTQRSSNG